MTTRSPEEVRAARALMAGPLPEVLKQMLMACCRPLFWFALDPIAPTILANGTITLVRTPKRTFGITANHVITGLEAERSRRPIRAQISQVVVDDLLDRLIDRSERLDLATVDLEGGLLEALGPTVAPLSLWPPMPPTEGHGIMIAGFPGRERREIAMLDASFGLSWAVGIAHQVTHDKITWVIPPEEYLVNTRDRLPRGYDFGGASGGPLIASFESKSGLFSHRLAGIIVEAHTELEYVIARRADSIDAFGKIGALTIF